VAEGIFYRRGENVIKSYAIVFPPNGTSKAMITFPDEKEFMRDNYEGKRSTPWEYSERRTAL
jgi:hypothetical protein